MQHFANSIFSQFKHTSIQKTKFNQNVYMFEKLFATHPVMPPEQNNKPIFVSVSQETPYTLYTCRTCNDQPAIWGHSEHPEASPLWVVVHLELGARNSIPQDQAPIQGGSDQAPIG